MSSGGAPCGACKFLRRKCVSGCIFAPYFDSEQGAAHFAAVHKVFGASNVSKLLQHIPPPKRCEAVVTICYEAQARLKDPVYGCVAHIFSLQQQVVNLQAELSIVQAQLASRLASAATSVAPHESLSACTTYASPYDHRPTQFDAPLSMPCHPQTNSTANNIPNYDRLCKEEAREVHPAFLTHSSNSYNHLPISSPLEQFSYNTQQQNMDSFQRNRSPCMERADSDDGGDLIQAFAYGLQPSRNYTIAKALSSSP